MINSSLGYYKAHIASGAKVFTSKMQALLYASSAGSTNVTYHYYDQVWDASLKMYKHNPSTILEKMYKTRALQIRETYDYLVLNFSGGVDSTTILETFIKNNIKLDEIYVRWPRRLVDACKYVPDINDRRATNMLSEWDFSIKPKLDWVREHHPEIKIVIDDWIDTVKQVNITEELLYKQNHNFGIANFGFSEVVSETAIANGNKGKRVANIFGIDKPILTYNPDTDKFATCFPDLTIMAAGNQHSHNKLEVDSRVNFYYSAEYPDLTLARAHAVALYVRHNPHLKKLIDSNVRKTATHDKKLEMFFEFDKVVNSICYPNWDHNTFQVAKPDNFNKIYHPWFHYLYTSDEFKDINIKLIYKLNDLSEGINPQFKTVDVNGRMVGLQMITTKLFTLNI
jgi:hypothetical protein